MTDEEFRVLTKRCDKIRDEVFQIPEKDYFLMAVSCVIDNWCRRFGYDKEKVAMEICQLIHMKEKKNGMH